MTRKKHPGQNINGVTVFETGMRVLGALRTLNGDANTTKILGLVSDTMTRASVHATLSILFRSKKLVEKKTRGIVGTSGISTLSIRSTRYPDVVWSLKPEARACLDALSEEEK